MGAVLAHPVAVAPGALDIVRLRHQAMLAASPAYFAQHVLMGPREAPYNGKFLIGRHHLEWDKLATGDQKVCVLASRNLGKSYYFSMALPLFFASYQPNATTFILGSTQDTAQMIMERITKQLETNPRLDHLVPKGRSKRRWNTSVIVLANGHEIHCAGMGTKKRGFHPDNIIGDDLLSDQDAYSETIRQRNINYWFSAIVPMLNPGGKMVVVGTPQSARDLLVGNLRTNPAYEYRVYPGEVAGVPTWGVRLSRDWLDARKAEIGSVRYAREILCQPVADTSSLFPMSLFTGDPVEQAGITMGMPKERWLEAGIKLYMGVDIAMSTEVGADYTVAIVLGVDGHGNRWLVDMFRGRGMPFQEQLAVIRQLGHRYNPAVIAIESNQAQRFVADELIRTTNLPIVRHTTTAAKHSLEDGLPSLKLLFENRKLRLPRGDARSIEETNILIDEFNNFTFVEGRVISVGEHDDVPMAFYIANLAPTLSTFSVSMGPDIHLSTGSPVPEVPKPRSSSGPPMPPPLESDPFGFGRR